jgi:hypothetical protein
VGDFFPLLVGRLAVVGRLVGRFGFLAASDFLPFAVSTVLALAAPF